MKTPHEPKIQQAPPSVYRPQDVERKWYNRWEGKGVFAPKHSTEKPAFSIVIPPPNVTGRLHMGHALNETLQDWIIRYRKMAGWETLWIPGCDHAGIATQNVVERELHKQGLNRQTLGREKFLEKVWKWKEKYGSEIMKQLRVLGASCDWTRERFTMDEGLSRAVREVFVRLYQKGLIVQGDYLIHWCPRCQTALSDIEVHYREVSGKLTYIHYPAEEGGEGVVVATTRPETLLGDTAVAVHPNDSRFQALIGKKVRLPLVGRLLPVLADGMVDPAFGTGAVKITPAHDFKDFQAGLRHHLPRINILNPDGTLNDQAGSYSGMDRYSARRKIVADLHEQGFLRKEEEYTHAVGHCYRCGTVVEPFFSKQWFVKMKPLAEEALKAVQENRIHFHPSHWKEEFARWLLNIQDWCISRQIWWGHRIPVFMCRRCGKQDAFREDPTACPACGGEMEQDPDVLDTWFSSALWPFSTLGWPEETDDLKRWYPTSVLVTSWDILFFWVARMVMMGLHFCSEVPFREVYIHSLVADEEGKKMSKSRGNVVDPLELVEKIGADALRFTLASIETGQRYVALTPARLEASRNFMNKLYNAVRFFLLRAPKSLGAAGSDLWRSGTRLEDRWIASRLHQIAEECRKNVEHYRAAEFAQTLYHFVWHEVCDWYLEAVKPRWGSEKGEELSRTEHFVRNVLDVVLRLLHPLVPFLTEELAFQLKVQPDVFLVERSFPKPEDFPLDSSALEEFRFVQDIVTDIRVKRAEWGILPGVVVSFQGENEEDHRKRCRETMDLIEVLSKARFTGWVNEKPRLSTRLPGGFYLLLEGVTDLENARARQEAEWRELGRWVERQKEKLGKSDFSQKAPAGVVAKEKEKLEQALERMEKIRQNLEDLGLRAH